MLRALGPNGSADLPRSRGRRGYATPALRDIAGGGAEGVTRVTSPVLTIALLCGIVYIAVCSLVNEAIYARFPPARAVI